MAQEEALTGQAELPRRRASFDARSLMDAAMASAPGITVLKAESEADELGAELAEKNYYPDFMVGVAPIQRDGRFESYDLMFQVNLPIWRGKYESLSNGAKARARAARSTLEAGRNKKALEVKGAAIEVEAAEKQIELFETSIVPQSELSYESALKNYRSGSVGLIALLDTGRL
jgi:outer membrane protein TolC